MPKELRMKTRYAMRGLAAVVALLLILTAADVWPPRARAAGNTKPIQLFADDDFAVTGGAPILTSSLTPGDDTHWPSVAVTFTIRADAACTISVLDYQEDANGDATGVGQTGALNGSSGALTADAWHTFTLGWNSAWSLNIQSDTTTRIHLIIDEIRVGAR